MGRVTKEQGVKPYHDDDAASTSSAVPLQNHAFADEDIPPAYTDNPETVESQPFIEGTESSSLDRLPGGESINSAQVHEDSKGSVSTYISKVLSSNPKTCQRFIERDALRVPQPMVRMLGTHMETRQRDKKEEKHRVTDFDIKAPLCGLLEQAWARTKIVANAQKTYRGGIVKQVDPRLKAHAEAAETAPSLKEWCHRFCASSASAKSFTVSRTVTGLEYHTLTQQMTEVLRSTNYRGHVSITYPIYSRATVIMSDHWLNRYRHNQFIWWTCVILQLWIFTWPLLWFMTKRWEVFSVEWPCRIYQQADGSWPSTHETVLDIAHEGQPTTDSKVRIAHMNEVEWVQKWKLAVQLAAESKKQGILTDADRRVAQAVEGRTRQQRAGGTAVVQNNGVLAAATGLLSGVQDLMMHSQTLRGWGGDC
ncbi:MAG: hypothetical protein Q9219_001626 [cf. Caloplaca sp. 3 TL-2023]